MTTRDNRRAYGRRPEQPAARSDSPPGADNESGSDLVIDGTPHAWEHALSRGAKARRALAAVMVVLVALFVLLDGPVALGTAAGELWQRLHQQTQASSLSVHPRAPVMVSAPPGAVNSPGLSLAPFNMAVGSVLACWIPHYREVGGLTAGDVAMARTTDFGTQWVVLRPPLALANSCHISADGIQPLVALAALGPPASASVTSCALPALFITYDAGGSWQPVPWPSTAAACGTRLAVAGGAIFAWSTTPMLAGGARVPPNTGRIIETDDVGRSWRPLDGALGNVSGLRVDAIRAHGALTGILAQTTNPTTGVSTLWQTLDDGTHWETLGPLPGQRAVVVVSSDPMIPATSWGQLYLLAYRSGGSSALGAPGSAMLATGTVSTRSVTWRAIAGPPLVSYGPVPVPDGPIAIAGVGPGQTLVVTRALDMAAAHPFSPEQQLWFWRPTTQHWSLDVDPLPADSAISALSWASGTATYWIVRVYASLPPIIGLVAETFAAPDV